MNPIPIIVVDDHPLFRQGVSNALALEPDFEVVGQAGTGEEALELIRGLHPMIAVIDVNLPGLNGQQVTRVVGNEKLSTRVILLTAYDDAAQQFHAMRAGAAAYCTKDVEPEMLADVIRAVVAGNYVIDGRVYSAENFEQWLDDHQESGQHHEKGAVEAVQPLSAREMEVLTYITRGLSNKEIASLLKISHQTVKNHVTAILRKLGVEDRTQATIYAFRRGWVRFQQQDGESQE